MESACLWSAYSQAANPAEPLSQPCFLAQALSSWLARLERTNQPPCIKRLECASTNRDKSNRARLRSLALQNAKSLSPQNCFCCYSATHDYPPDGIGVIPYTGCCCSDWMDLPLHPLRMRSSWNGHVNMLSNTGNSSNRQNVISTYRLHASTCIHRKSTAHSFPLPPFRPTTMQSLNSACHSANLVTLYPCDRSLSTALSTLLESLADDITLAYVAAGGLDRAATPCDPTADSSAQRTSSGMNTASRHDSQSEWMSRPPNDDATIASSAVDMSSKPLLLLLLLLHKGGKAKPAHSGKCELAIDFRTSGYHNGVLGDVEQGTSTR